MTAQSTAKMLARMVGEPKSQNSVKVDQELPEEFSVPQLRPDMQQELTNILGAYASKKYTPMD